MLAMSKKITRIGALPWRGDAGVVTFAEVSKEKARGLNPRRVVYSSESSQQHSQESM